MPVEQVGGYRIILADPAWQYGDRKPRGGAENHYPTMSLAELRGLPVDRLAARDAVLFMWATRPLIKDALALIDAWGFEYKTEAFTWVKTTRTETKLHFGLGRWTRGNTEPCLLGVRGDIRRADASVPQIILDLEEHGPLLVAPIGRHSAKPPEARERIEKLMGPTHAKIELFARDRAPGWDVWGNEIASDVELVGEAA